MKRYFLLPAAACLFFLFSFNNAAQSQLKYGAGLSYGTWLNTPGLNLRADVELLESFSIVPMVDIFVPRFNIGTFLAAASIHLHYHIEIADALSVYPLLGAALKGRLDFDSYGNNRVDMRWALNPTGGAGAQLEITRDFALFVETRLELGNFNQFVGTAGILIRPGR